MIRFCDAAMFLSALLLLLGVAIWMGYFAAENIHWLDQVSEMLRMELMK